MTEPGKLQHGIHVLEKELNRDIAAAESGYILGLVMIFFVIFSILGLSFINMGVNERIHASRDYHKERAYYYAHSGIHKGLWRVSKISNVAGTFSDATVSVAYDSVALTLTAVGTSGGQQDSIKVTVTKSGGGTIRNAVLQVVNNPSSPSSQATYRKTLLESWGYVVTFIDDDDSQSNFNAAAQNADIAYVMSEISSSSTSKLVNFAIGVVNEEDNGDDELYFSSTHGSNYTGQLIAIIDNTHYITSTFSTGDLTVLNSSDDLTYLSGTQAIGLQVLAERQGSSSDVLGVLEAGATLYGGGSAAGRRVRLPWSDININNLTSDGQTLLKRSIEWAAGGPVATVPPTVTIATWKL